MKKFITALLLVISFIITQITAQSLVAIAKKSREHEKGKKISKVYTNKDLRKSKDPSKVTRNSTEKQIDRLKYKKGMHKRYIGIKISDSLLKQKEVY